MPVAFSGGGFGGPGPGLGSRFIGLPVNTAGVEGRYADGSIVLRTGSSVNPVGAYNGPIQVGNKALLGALGFAGLPIGALLSVSYTWRNLLGPTGVPGPPSVTVPYCNLVVDFAPAAPGGNLRILVLMDRQLAPTISAAIGGYSAIGPLVTHAWQSVESAPGVNGHALIVNSPPLATPGGVVPNVQVGLPYPANTWPENAFRWADLVAANPGAVLVDAFPANPLFPAGDDGMPVGALLPSILLVSGDSLNVVKSGKQLTAWQVNGVPLIP